MAESGRKQPEGGLLSRIGFSGWMLLGVGLAMLALHLCRNQGTFEHLDEWDFHLRGAGKVILLSGDETLGRTRAAGVTIVPWDRTPDVMARAAGTDAAALAGAVKAAGARLIIVGTDVVAAGRAPGGSVLGRLALFKPVDGFHALVIRPQGAVIELAAPPAISSGQMAKLLALVRRELSSGEDGRAAAEEGGAPGGGDVEVAVQLQGLAPQVVDKKNVHMIREDLVASGRDASLEAAAVKAAAGIRKSYKDDFEKTEGPLSEALKRLTIELHVLYDLSLVQHVRGELDEAAYWKFMGAVLTPGVHGVYVNRLGPDTRGYLGKVHASFRLPSDAVYWMRTTGKKVLERTAKDMHLEGPDALAGRKDITLDRFRTVHAGEVAPGGPVVFRSMGLPLVGREDVGVEAVKAWGARAGRWLEERLKPDGTLAAAYLPDRDSETIEKTSDITFDASRPILSSLAFQGAQRLTGRAAYGQDLAESSIQILSWLKLCPGARAAALKGAAWKPGQVLESCGPMQRDGTPAKVESWGQGGQDPKPVPENMVFLFSGTRAGLEETALAGILLAGRVLQFPAEEESQRKQVEASTLPIVEGIVEFVLFMQKADGSFHSYFVSENNAFYRSEDPEGGPAAVLFLAQAVHLVKDKRLKPALASALARHLGDLEERAAVLETGVPSKKKAEKDIVRTAGLGLVALAQAALALGDADAQARVVKAALEMMSAQLDRAAHPFIEPAFEGGFACPADDVPDADSLILTQGLIRASAVAKALGMAEEEKKLAAAAASGMAFGAMLQLRLPESTFFVPAPKRADGGVRQSPLISRQRIDAAAWFIEACAAYVDVFGGEARP